jgi:two-component system OmpR family sensor kinase
MLGHLSIRQRLALWYTALLAITLILFSVIVYTVAQNQLQNSVQDDVKNRAILIAAALQNEYDIVASSATQGPAATASPGATATASNTPAATATTTQGTPGATSSPTPVPTPDQKKSQDIQQQLIIRVPEALKGLGFGFEVLDRQKKPLSRATSLNNNDLPQNPSVLDAALRGTPGSYTARSGSSLLSIYVQPITYTYPVYGPSTNGSQVGKPQVIGVVLTAKSLDDVNGTLNTLSRLLVIGDLIALLFASLGGWLIAESGLRPIATVTRAARAIAHSASGRGLGTRVSYSGPNDEVGELVTTFNDMLASIERVANAQRRFVADASHELRAPLTTIKGSLDFLRRAPDLSETERRATVEDAYAESDRMASLVSDLLLLARVDAAASGTYGLREAWLDEQLRTRREPIQLDEIAMDIFRHGRAQLHARGKDLHFSVTNIEPVTIIGDPGQIRQLALILLDNAIKYTPAGGKIRISVTRNGNRAAFSITDTGIGILPEDRPHIFERFYRADQARERDEHGSGLGLAIARWIAGAHEGDISVHSQPGQGSTFTLLLPALADGDGRASTTKPHAVQRGKRESRTPPIGIGSIYPLARLARSVSGPRKPATSKPGSDGRQTHETRANRRRQQHQQQSHKGRG